MLAMPMLDARSAITPCSLRAALANALSNATRLRINDDNCYELSLAAPGVSASDMKVTFEDGVLEIAGKTGTRSAAYSTSLPGDADVDKATCSHVDGILTVIIPRTPEAEPVVVPINAEAEEQEAEDTDAATKPYTLTISAPGISPSDLLIVAEDEALKLVGETKRRRIQKVFRLPRDADGAFASATVVDGIITITVPKKAAEAKTLVVSPAAAVEATEPAKTEPTKTEPVKKVEAKEVDETEKQVEKEAMAVAAEETVAEPVAAAAAAGSTSTATGTKAVEATPEPDAKQEENVRAALATMGFTEAMVEAAVAKHGEDVEACARVLAAATEWDPLLDDLSEMGFPDRELNATILLKHDGNLKRTVKELASSVVA